MLKKFGVLAMEKSTRVQVSLMDLSGDIMELIRDHIPKVRVGECPHCLQGVFLTRLALQSDT